MSIIQIVPIQGLTRRLDMSERLPEGAQGFRGPVMERRYRKDGLPEDRQPGRDNDFEARFARIEERLMDIENNADGYDIRIKVLESATEQLQDVSIDDLQTQLDRLKRGLNASGVV